MDNKYIDLLKLFYKDQAEHQHEYSERYNNKLVAFHFGLQINGQEAFFMQLPQLFMSIDRIMQLNTNVQVSISELPAKAIQQFAERCLIDEVIMTNEIEGIRSTRRELHDVLVSQNENKKKKFSGILRMYNILNSSEMISINSCDDIRTIYDRLLFAEIEAEDKSKLPDGKWFRKEGVDVIAETQKTIHHGLAPEKRIIEMMDKSLQILNDESIHILFRASLFHYLLGYIHPFYDGNGRMSRFISSYLLNQNLNKLIGYRLSYTINQYRKDYYDGFKICNHILNKGDLTPFVLMFIGIIEKSMVQLNHALNIRVNDYNSLQADIRNLPLGNDRNFYSIYDLLIQAALFAEHGISTLEMLAFLDITRQTLSQRLKKIKGTGLLKEQKIGKHVYYALDSQKMNKTK